MIMEKKHYMAPSACTVQVEARLLEFTSTQEEVGNGVQLSRYTNLHNSDNDLWDDED